MNRLFTILSVTSRLFRWVPLLTVMLALAAKSPAQEKVRQPDLYYLVVDMSGSIPIYGLKQPIIDEVTRFIKSLPDQCVLKVQLFDHQILPQWKREIGPRMTDIAKEDMIQWFRRTYDPKGNTFLYDVTGGALREIEKDRDVYDSVRLIILSDGINDTGGLPSKYPDWASLVPLTKSLTKGGKTGDAVWLYLEAVKQDAKKPQPAASEVPRPLEPIKTIIVGRDDTLIIEKAIRPEVQFDAHPREVSAGNAVQFFLVKETAVKTYTWTFSDGQESKERLPRVTFKSPGKIDVKLIVEGPGGKTEQKEEAFIQVLENAPPPKPSALFIAHPTTVNPGQKVLFTVRSNIGSSSYEWNFGDGATSTEAQPLHAFDKAGSYDVTLKATGPGGSDSSVLKAAVEVQALPKPSAAFTVHPPSVFVGEEVLCTVQSTAGIESYKWNLGDGSSSTDAQPRHAYAKAGSYDVTLDVSGPGGSDRSESKGAVQVKEIIPDLVVVKFSAKPAKGRAPLKVQFTDESKGQIARYAWDFGDGITSDLRNPEHSFQKPGDYRPRLTVSNLKGVDTSSTTEILIVVNTPPKPMPPWLLPFIIIIGSALIWVFILVPMLTAKARRKAADITLDFGGGDARTLSECLAGRFSSLKTIFLPVREALLGSGAKGAVEVPGCTETHIATISPAANGSCTLKAATDLKVDGSDLAKGQQQSFYPDTKASVTGAGAAFSIIVPKYEADDDL